MIDAGKVAVITGASGAIGSAVAKRFADSGYSLVLSSRTRRESCDRQVEVFRVAGVKVDVLVNIAGATVGSGSVDELSAVDWEAAFAANFYTAVYCSQAALNEMTGRKGWIINTSSVRGLWASGRPEIMAYSMAKAALINYTSTLAKTVGPDIMVNAVAPGFVWTPNYAAMSEELQKSFIEATILKRFITAEELADSYLFLASTTCITGPEQVQHSRFNVVYRFPWQTVERVLKW